MSIGQATLFQGTLQHTGSPSHCARLGTAPVHHIIAIWAHWSPLMHHHSVPHCTEMDPDINCAYCCDVQ